MRSSPQRSGIRAPASQRGSKAAGRAGAAGALAPASSHHAGNVADADIAADSQDSDGTDLRLAQRLRMLRQDRGWSLDQLADRSGVSRATLSRIENGEVSPTASVLGRLCTAHGLTMSRLMRLVEDEFRPKVGRAEQPVWTDPGGRFTRRSVSPPADPLRAELIECTLEPDTRIDYDAPARPGLEHHLLLLKGALTLTVDGVAHSLKPGDCLRYLLDGPTRFRTPQNSGARYLLVVL